MFFVRASIKERRERAYWRLPPEPILTKVRAHFQRRGYQPQAVAPGAEVVTLEGQVAASAALAIFLSLLTLLGLGCLALVLSLAAPEWGPWVWGLPALAPLAGAFYWRGAQRPEIVQIALKADGRLGIEAHRDEIRQLQTALPDLGAPETVFKI
ncbi:MAG: cofactor assembly of complex C subunit B [Oscillatoriales cyanobacterium SM2_1_8]|nr:cofactor assembly of complex C subunit B [Oscillatoriales cyanobacterium SM2_1_8]